MIGAIADDLALRARAIRLLTCDVDGVLTDGTLYYDDDGKEMKAFSIARRRRHQDAAHAGVTVALDHRQHGAGGRRIARAQLGVRHLVQGADDKLAPWDALRGELGARRPRTARTSATICPTCRCFARCGLGVRCRMRRASVRDRAHYVTLARRRRGRGARSSAS